MYRYPVIAIFLGLIAAGNQVYLIASRSQRNTFPRKHTGIIRRVAKTNVADFHVCLAGLLRAAGIINARWRSFAVCLVIRAVMAWHRETLNSEWVARTS